MARPEKVQAVADIKQRVEESEAVFVTEYAGLKVAEQQALRRGLRSADAEFKVVKMTLARRAVDELGHEELLELLSGPTGLAFASSDPVPAAKALRDFNRDHAALVIKGMLMGGQVLTPEQVSVLADIEPREVLLAKLAGAFQAPLTGFVGALSALIRKTGYGFQALLNRRIAAGESLEAAAAPPEAPAPEGTEAPEAETDTPEEEAETDTPEEEAGTETAEEAEIDTAEEAETDTPEEAETDTPEEEAGTDTAEEAASETAEEAETGTAEEAGTDTAEEAATETAEEAATEDDPTGDAGDDTAEPAEEE